MTNKSTGFCTWRDGLCQIKSDLAHQQKLVRVLAATVSEQTHGIVTPFEAEAQAEMVLKRAEAKVARQSKEERHDK